MNTPTERIVGRITETSCYRDSLGRQLTFRHMTALDRLRLFKAIGPVLSQNSPYIGMAMLASTVTAIDGVPVPAPSNEAQLEALVAKLEDAGIAAAAEAHAASQATLLGSAAQGN